MISTKYRDRCVAYITKENMLLVFEHIKYPEYGVQVSAGHPEKNESLDSAVLREAEEETGLKELQLIEYLEYKKYDLSGKGLGLERRHFYHLRYEGETPVNWVHAEEHPSIGPDEKLDFLLYWVPISEPNLHWDHGAMLMRLNKLY